MKKLSSLLKYFTKTEIALWGASIFTILLSFFIFDRSNYLILFASLVGATSLIFNAKGNPFGQFLMIIFSLIYAIISYEFCYYGEMITYLGMTAPMALIALVSWLKHPYNGKKSEVTVNLISNKEIPLIIFSSALITVIFWFVLKAFNTTNIIPSTISVTTSFLAVYLTFRRSPFFALAYASNDVVLISLWVLATIENVAYLSVVVCFVAFLANDIYGYVNWTKMQKKQTQNSI